MYVTCVIHEVDEAYKSRVSDCVIFVGLISHTSQQIVHGSTVKKILIVLLDWSSIYFAYFNGC